MPSTVLSMCYMLNRIDLSTGAYLVRDGLLPPRDSCQAQPIQPPRDQPGARIRLARPPAHTLRQATPVHTHLELNSDQRALNRFSAFWLRSSVKSLEVLQSRGRDKLRDKVIAWTCAVQTMKERKEYSEQWGWENCFIRESGKTFS